MSELPLEGIRILDFTWVVAGPVATRILADHGAEVIKIERKPGPSAPRQTGLQGDLHRDKLSIAVNMANPRGIEVAMRLAQKCDVVIDNFSARVMRNWGMDYANLSRIKPDIICVSMSGFGHIGPRSSYVSYGPTLHALAGYTTMMADESGEVTGFGYSYADMVGGYTGALAVLMALRYRRLTGRGQFVDLAQFEAVTSVIGPSLLDIAVNGRKQSPPNYRSQELPAAPYGVYRCCPLGDDKDRWLAIAVRSQSEWDRFVIAIGSPSWTNEAKFRTLYLRIHNRAELDDNVARWTVSQDAEAAMEMLQRAGIAAGLVSNGADICDRNPHLKAREFWGSVTTLDGTKTGVTGIPMKYSATPVSIRTPSPMIGSGNDYVLGEILGYSRAEIEELAAATAIWA